MSVLFQTRVRVFSLSSKASTLRLSTILLYWVQRFTPPNPETFMDPSQYHQEYRAYMEFALQRFLIEQRDFTEYDAKTKVMQDFEEVEREAREAGYL